MGDYKTAAGGPLPLDERMGPSDASATPLLEMSENLRHIPIHVDHLEKHEGIWTKYGKT